ncbi:unnamed protein product [Cercospora beticola]|nr:unnamed protein product [Cercospora beticola]
MGCCETGHSHSWPTDGVLVIQRCEVRCNFCTGDKATKPWKYAWFLRRHVRAIHCKKGKGEGFDLQVSTQWRAPADPTNVLEQAENASQKSKLNKRTSIKTEAEDEDGEEGLGEEKPDDVAKFGAYSMGKSADTIWVPQPIYLDVPNQFPGMNRGFHPLDHRDVQFDQTLVFGDLDIDTLMDTADVNSFFNDETIGLWLASNLRGPLGVDSEEDDSGIKQEDDASSIKMDDIPEIGEDGGPKMLGRTGGKQGADAVAMQCAAFFNVDEDGEDLDAGSFMDESEGHPGGKFFMPQDADPADIDTFWSNDDALAQVSSMANIFNTARPPMTDDALEMLKVLEATSGVMSERGVDSEVMARTFGQFARMLAQRAAFEDESLVSPIEDGEGTVMDLS